eukprot:403337478
MDQSLLQKVLQRWHAQPQQDPDQYELKLLQTQKKFKNYKYSIYVLNRHALKIQHWYYRIKNACRKSNDMTLMDCTQSFQFHNFSGTSFDSFQQTKKISEQIKLINEAEQYEFLSLSQVDPLTNITLSNLNFAEQSVESKEFLFMTDKILIPPNINQELSQDLQQTSLNDTSNQSLQIFKMSQSEILVTPRFDEDQLREATLRSSNSSQNSLQSQSSVQNVQKLIEESACKVQLRQPLMVVHKILDLSEESDTRKSQEQSHLQSIGQITFLDQDSFRERLQNDTENVTFMENSGSNSFQLDCSSIICKAVSNKQYKNPFRKDNDNYNSSQFETQSNMSIDQSMPVYDESFRSSSSSIAYISANNFIDRRDNSTNDDSFRIKLQPIVQNYQIKSSIESNHFNQENNNFSILQQSQQSLQFEQIEMLIKNSKLDLTQSHSSIIESSSIHNISQSKNDYESLTTLKTYQGYQSNSQQNFESNRSNTQPQPITAFISLISPQKLGSQFSSPKKESLRYHQPSESNESLKSIISYNPNESISDIELRVNNLEIQTNPFSNESLNLLHQMQEQVEEGSCQTNAQQSTDSDQSVTPNRKRRTRAERLQNRDTSQERLVCFKESTNYHTVQSSNLLPQNPFRQASNLKSKLNQLQDLCNLDMESRQYKTIDCQENNQPTPQGFGSFMDSQLSSLQTSLADSDLDKYFQSTQQNMTFKIFNNSGMSIENEESIQQSNTMTSKKYGARLRQKIDIIQKQRDKSKIRDR